MAWHGVTLHGTDGMGWDGMGWDGMGWDGMGWDGMGWDGMGWDGMAWHGMAWHGMAWHGMAQHGMPMHTHMAGGGVHSISTPPLLVRPPPSSFPYHSPSSPNPLSNIDFHRALPLALTPLSPHPLSSSQHPCVSTRHSIEFPYSLLFSLQPHSFSAPDCISPFLIILLVAPADISAAFRLSSPLPHVPLIHPLLPLRFLVQVTELLSLPSPSLSALPAKQAAAAAARNAAPAAREPSAADGADISGLSVLDLCRVNYAMDLLSEAATWQQVLRSQPITPATHSSIAKTLLLLDSYAPACYPAAAFLSWVSKCSVVLCGALWCSVVLCGALWCSLVLCGTLQCSLVLCGTLQCSLVLCGTLQCSLVLCGTLSVVLCGALSSPTPLTTSPLSNPIPPSPALPPPTPLHSSPICCLGILGL
ncbi:unnamed protein product [Closterium sp. NIES-54]